MGVASKTLGWEFQAPRKDYWHKCILNRTARHTVAQVVHCTSGVVLSASTEEPSINKHLYSNTDTSAAENIGRILAYRCQCLGIVSLFFDAVLSKIRQGYVWDEFYHRMVKPKDMAAWQVEQDQIFTENLGKDISEKLAEAEKPAEVYIPEKWRLE
ncbi:unnamed protein product [Dibothriocephalus latus]|uniref:Uncharacterized protein n=1 Tax=Dibothriocephalus latus TaxID=60516 RepID=A0A3P7LHC4_DIBLA|nr:unnamed protein product [Dibothriocephalus latus]